MTLDDIWMALVLTVTPLGLYLGLSAISPLRPRIRKGEVVLGWISERLWWLIAANGMLWAGAHLLIQSEWFWAGVAAFVLSLPIFVATTTCGIIAYLRYLNRQF